MLRSGMMGWLTIMQDTTTWTEEQHAVAKEEFRTYKSSLRPLIRDASIFHISPRPDGVRWDGMEYYDSQTGKGVVYAFRGSQETEPTLTYKLQGLKAAQPYRLHFHDHSAPDRSARGAELMQAGLSIELRNPNSSELILLEEAREAIP
jgi:hypothetical protein